MTSIQQARITPASHYSETLFSDHIISIMKKGNILTTGTPAEMLAELIRRLASAEQSMGESDADSERTLTDFYDYLRSGTCILGSPLLTNIAAGHQALASCSAVPINVDRLSHDDLDLAEAYYKINVGSGYNLTSATDPCRSLIHLNAHAAEVEGSNVCERYVGNIAHVSIRHPRVDEFIKIKTETNGIIHFNTSVDVDTEYMEAVTEDRAYEMMNGRQRSALEVWNAMVDAAWQCGDPGIISLQRYNAGNALAFHSPYVTTAPCAEVGLAPGESCVFGYINLAACVRMKPQPSLDLALIGKVSKCLTRILDDAIDLSIKAFPDVRSQMVMLGKRKIGIGICGFADALMWLGIDYGSEMSIQMLADALATINFESKVASMQLAERRGSFLAFQQSAYAYDRTFLERFGRVSSVVPESGWCELSAKVMTKGLRHVMTTALPPSGRSALLCGVNPSIEPYLTLQGRSSEWVTPVRSLLAEGFIHLKDSRLSVSPSTRDYWPASATTSNSLFRTSTQITPEEHFRILGTAAALVDDGVSKTVNLATHTPRSTVDQIFRTAWTTGLKAISIYRSSSPDTP